MLSGWWIRELCARLRLLSPSTPLLQPLPTIFNDAAPDGAGLPSALAGRLLTGEVRVLENPEPMGRPFIAARITGDVGWLCGRSFSALLSARLYAEESANVF